MSLRSFWGAAADRILRRPLLPVLVWTALTFAALYTARGLRLRPELTELLPKNQPSVVELNRVMARTRGVSNVFVVLEGPPADRLRLRTAADAVAAALTELQPPCVGSAETGVQQARAFLLPRAGLFADVTALEELRNDIARRSRRGFAQAVGADLAGDLEEPDRSADEDAQRWASLFGAQLQSERRYPDGYYQSADGGAVAVAARSRVVADDVPAARACVERIRTTTNEVLRAPSFAGLRAGFAGDLVTGLAEYSAVAADLLDVGLLGVGLVLLVLLVYYVSLRALLVMGLTIAAGCALTFGLTALTLHSLNTATGFLFSIVAGNGINSGIILQSRYLEERATQEPVDAARAAVASTGRATLGAALAAAAAYGALALTPFRAFREFALIGGGGMLICWVTTVALMPPLLVLSERVWPANARSAVARAAHALRERTSRFDRPVSYILTRAPRVVAVLGFLLGALGLFGTVRYVRGWPLETDLRRMENDKSTTTELYRISALAAQLVGANTEGAMVVLADRLDQVGPLRDALLARRDAAPASAKPFATVHTIFDFVPAEQSRKIKLLESIRRGLLRGRSLNMMTDREWKRVEPLLPPPDLQPFSVADLPDAIRRLFTEADGTVGRLLFIEPAAGERDSDLRYLLRWADSFRATRLPTGEVVHGTGRAVIYADLVSSVISSAPICLAGALLLTLLVIVVAFPSWRAALATVSALLLGLAWLGGSLYALSVRIHFINFIALPITLGVGADYAVNIMGRYRQLGGGAAAARAAVRHAAAPVILCSATTTLGYLALLTSRNQAVRSLGTIAVLGEVTCLLAAVLVLPAGLILWSRRASAARAPDPTLPA